MKECYILGRAKLLILHCRSKYLILDQSLVWDKESFTVLISALGSRDGMNSLCGANKFLVNEAREDKFSAR